MSEQYASATPPDPAAAGSPDRSAELGRRRVVTRLTAVLVALVVVGFVTVWVLNQQRTPQATAEEYLAHVAAGDASAANALLSTDPSDSSLLTDEVLGAAVAHIRNVTVTPRAESEGAGSFASVDVVYQLGSGTYEGVVRLRAGEPAWGVLTTWQVEQPFGSATVLTLHGEGEVALSGVPIPLSEGEYARTATLTLYPAIYPLSVLGSDLVDLHRSEFVVTLDAAPNAFNAFNAFMPNATFKAVVQKQVDALLDSCASQTLARSDECPLRAQSDVGDGPVQWAIIEYPKVGLPFEGDLYFAQSGRVRETYFIDGESEPTVLERDLSFSGELTIEDGEVTVFYNRKAVP